MTFDIDNAIQHCHEKAKDLKIEATLIKGLPLGGVEQRRADCLECAKEHEQLALWLEELKARREADRWIPVSERLPDKSDWYFATMVGEFGNTHTYSVFYSTTNKTFEFLEKVTAWKPLPEPYKENDNG